MTSLRLAVFAAALSLPPAAALGQAFADSDANLSLVPAAVAAARVLGTPSAARAALDEAVPAAAFAAEAVSLCDQAKDKPLTDQDISLWLEQISHLSRPIDRNRFIEGCFERNTFRLSWRHVQRLLAGLSFVNRHDEHDEIRTRTRIVASYMKRRIKGIAVHTAIEVAAEVNDASANNLLLEAYFTANSARLIWSEVKTLLGAVKHVNRHHRNDELQTTARIVEAYMTRHAAQLSPVQAVEVAHANTDLLAANRQIEAYFLIAKSRLRWEDVQALTRALRHINRHDHYDETRTKDRIIKAWIDCQQP